MTEWGGRGKRKAFGWLGTAEGPHVGGQAMATKKVASKKSAVAKKTVTAKKPSAPAKRAPAKAIKKVAPAKKPATSKKPAPKAAVKKAAPKAKAPAKKVAAKKSVAKKVPAKKVLAKKVVAKKPAAKKPVVKKPVAKKPAPKATAKKVAKAAKPAKKVPAKVAPKKVASAKKAAPKAAKKPAPKAAGKDAAKPIKKDVAKPVAKVAPKTAPKAQTKPVATPAPKPEPKAEPPVVRVVRTAAVVFGAGLPLPAPTSWDPKKRTAIHEKPLTSDELKVFRKLVEEAGRKMQGNLDALTRDNLKRSDLDGDMVTDTSAHATHSADHGTDNFDREMALNLACGRQEELVQIREALRRIDDGTYGICEICGNPIGRARLKAKPYAKLCIECKSKAEQGVPKFRPLSKSASLPTSTPEPMERDENAPADE